MLNSRFFVPLFFALAVLFAQQGGALHALRHAFAEQTQQRDKQTPHSKDCEQCTSYAQLGSALNSGYLSFELLALPIQPYAQQHFVFFTQQTFAATARGPPVFQRPA